MEKSELKRVIVNACSSDESESKSVHISVNTSEVKGAMNETKDKEPLVTDNSVINATIYFKLFECHKNFSKNLMPRMNEHAWKLRRKNGIRQSLGMDECAC